jgi:hypothetical protein
LFDAKQVGNRRRIHQRYGNRGVLRCRLAFYITERMERNFYCPLSALDWPASKISSKN